MSRLIFFDFLRKLLKIVFCYPSNHQFFILLSLSRTFIVINDVTYSFTRMVFSINIHYIKQGNTFCKYSYWNNCEDEKKKKRFSKTKKMEKKKVKQLDNVCIRLTMSLIRFHIPIPQYQPPPLSLLSVAALKRFFFHYSSKWRPYQGRFLNAIKECDFH